MTEAPSPSPSPALRVLVVDDNVDAANSVSQLLSLCGVDSTAAHSGSSALALAREAPLPFDVALLDIGMPGMDGWTLGRQLLAEHPRMRIFALTGYGEPDDRERARQLGFEGLLVKPVDPEQLLGLFGVA